MATEIKYRHPAEPSLIWSGKGKQPKWVAFYVGNDGPLSDLLVNQAAPAIAQGGDDSIDLGILDGSATPTLGEKLYAGRIAAGQTPMPDDNSPSFTPGVRQALAESGAPRDNLDQPGTEVREVAQPEASQQQLEVCLQEFGFQSLTAEEFIQAGIEEFNQAMVRTCRAGVAFWAAQEAIKSTECAGRTQDFQDWIASAGLTKERVYECIRVAKFYSRLPEENRAKALTIGKKHALLLASLPQDVIDRAAESGNDLLEKADLMTVAELKEEIKALRRREKNYEAEIERAQGQVKRLSAARTRTTDFLLRTEEIREECMALQLGSELHLNSLKKLFEETDAAAPEGRLQLEQLWVTAHTVAARALDLVQLMQDQAPEGMPKRVMGTHILSVAEAERWLLDYPSIENRYAAEQAKRQEKRDAAKPKGPGRPAGSGSKKGEA